MTGPPHPDHSHDLLDQQNCLKWPHLFAIAADLQEVVPAASRLGNYAPVQSELVLVDDPEAVPGSIMPPSPLSPIQVDEVHNESEGDQVESEEPPP